MAYDFLEDLEDDLSDEELETLTHFDRDYKGSSQAIHDRLQFQADFDIDLNLLNVQETHKRYQMDAYLFIPQAMGVNRDNFNRDQYYACMTNYMRIRTPSLSEESLNGHGPIPAASRYFQVHLLTHLRQQLEPLVVQEVKLFGCYLNTQLKKARTFLLDLLRKRPSNMSHRLQLLEKFLVRILQSLSDYRLHYMHKVRHQAFLIDHEVRKAFLLVDEYFSYRLEATLIYMYQRLETEDHVLSRLLEAALSSEMEYRQHENLVQLQTHANESQRETYYYRLGLLKKYVSDVLYLQQENVRKDKAYRNLVAAAGAALAAFWAGLIDLQRFYWLNQPSQQQNASDFGIRFFLIVVIGVVAYIFKDRIKEASREYFFERLKHHLPDFEFEMVYNHYDHQAQAAKDIKIGRTKQYMRFLQKNALPPEIHYIRELGHDIELDPERNEQIIHFSQSLLLDTQTIARNGQIHILRNILRWSIAPFLEKLDNPNKNMRYFDPQQGISMIKAPKVYHVNVIFRYASVSQYKDEPLQGEQIEFERVRLILDKQGILRIEPVLPRGAMGYTEQIA